MTSQVTSIDLDPIPSLLLGPFLFRFGRPLPEKNTALENRTSSENYDLKFGMYTYSTVQKIY